MTVVRRRPVRIVTLSVVVFLLAVLTAQVAWNYHLAPRLAIRKIILDSDLGLSDGQLMEMLSLDGETWASLNEDEIGRRLESYPVVRRATAVKVFPDTLKLYVYRRRPLVVAFVGDGNTTVPAVFDEDGFAVQVGPGSGPLNLPVISGPQFPEPSLGVRLPDGFEGVLGHLSRLRAEDPRMFSLISEVEMVSRGSAGFDLKLYMNHVPIPILVDRDMTAETVRQAVLVLDVLAADSIGNVAEADMRGGYVVFRRSEES